MIRVLVLAMVVLLAAVAPAQGQLLEPADAAELANVLAEATEEQDVCYSWNVAINDEDAGTFGFDRGSNDGPGAPPIGCTDLVTLEAEVRYTCGSCESEDSASFSVTSTIEGVDKDGLERLGLDAGGLLGDRDDERLFNMVSALPLLVAEATGRAVPLETAATVPAQDGLTGDPGSDTLREQWPWFVLWGGIALYAPIYLLRARARNSKKGRANAA